MLAANTESGGSGLGDYFDAVSDSTNITHSKPSPEVFLKAAEMLGLALERCLVVVLSYLRKSQFTQHPPAWQLFQ